METNVYKISQLIKQYGLDVYEENVEEVLKIVFTEKKNTADVENYIQEATRTIWKKHGGEIGIKDAQVFKNKFKLGVSNSQLPDCVFKHFKICYKHFSELLGARTDNLRALEKLIEKELTEKERIKHFIPEDEWNEFELKSLFDKDQVRKKIYENLYQCMKALRLEIEEGEQIVLFQAELRVLLADDFILRWQNE